MLVIDISRCNAFYSQKYLDESNKRYPLYKDVLGYTDDEFEKIKEDLFYPPLAINLTKEEVGLIMQPFWDYDISVFAYDIDENTGKMSDFYKSTDFGVISQPPQQHYYDSPVVPREKLIDPWNIPTFHDDWIYKGIYATSKPSTPVVTCPYCQSTDTKKITNTSKAIHTAIFGIFSMGRNSKQWHCNKCGSDF